MPFLSSFRTKLLLFCALGAGLQPQLVATRGTRKLQQSNGPANIYGNAASATTADLVNDPAGRAHLLVGIASLRQKRCGRTAVPMQPDSFGARYGSGGKWANCRHGCFRQDSEFACCAGAPGQPCSLHWGVSPICCSRPVHRRPLRGPSSADSHQRRWVRR